MMLARRDAVVRETRLWTLGGLSGVLATVCYILAIALPWPENQIGRSTLLLVISAWPILSIIYSYGLYRFIASECQSTANRMAFVFAIAAFTTVLAMVIVQLAVGAAFADIARGLDEQTANVLRRGLRMVDLGLDVAWDMLIGTALVLLGFAMRRRKGLGPGWAFPSVLFGAALIGLNAATFPWPPADGGLFEIGPAIGLFIIALAARLAVLSWRSTD